MARRVFILVACTLGTATTVESHGVDDTHARKAAPNPQFANVTALNRSATQAAVAALMATKLHHYELQNDAIAGRRHLGALPSELSPPCQGLFCARLPPIRLRQLAKSCRPPWWSAVRSWQSTRRNS